MQPHTIEQTPPVCGEALTEAGTLLVATVAGAYRPAGAGVANWRRVWSTFEKAFSLWRDVRPAGDLVIFDRIAEFMDRGEGELDALVFGLLLGAFVEDQGVPAVDSKTQALVYLVSGDLLHQTLGVDWLRAHSPATVKRLKFLLADAVRTRTAGAPGPAGSDLDLGQAQVARKVTPPAQTSFHR